MGFPRRCLFVDIAMMDSFFKSSALKLAGNSVVPFKNSHSYRLMAESGIGREEETNKKNNWIW